MAKELTGQRIAFMASNEGMEQVEFTRPDYDGLMLPGGVANPDQLRASGKTWKCSAALPGRMC